MLLDAIGYVGGPRNRRIAIGKVVAEREALGRDFGIRLSEGRVSYSQHTEVWFEPADDRPELPARDRL